MSSPGPQAKRQKLPEDVRRKAILDAALQLFLQNGFERTRMDDVAALAGLTKGGLYFHFKGKKALFASLVSALAERLDEHLLLAMQEPGSPSKRISNYMQALFHEFTKSMPACGKHNRMGRFELLLAACRFPELDQQITAAYRRVVNYLVPLVEEGVKQGVFTSIDAEATARGLLAALDGLIFQYDLDQDAFDLRSTLDQVTSVHLRGMAAVV